MRISHPNVIVFDMDGVLVTAIDSYWEATRATVRHFTGQTVTREEIQEFKNQGGWNNDWLLAQRLISDRGRTVEYADIVEYFNQVFLGEDGDGLIQREKWLPEEGLLERLEQRYALAIFTGRAKYEADVTLGRYATRIRFQPLITDECVAKPKPAPEGLELIRREHPNKTIWYLGDTIDDALSAQSAGVPFIGVAIHDNPNHKENAAILRGHGAFTVLSDVNELERLLNEHGA